MFYVLVGFKLLITDHDVRHRREHCEDIDIQSLFYVILMISKK